MAYKESVPDKSPIIKIKKVGEVYEGYYLRTRKGEFGIIYDFIEQSGVPYSIGSNADLIMKMAIVPEGSKVKIELTGTQDTGKGSPMKVYKVLYDENDNFHGRRKKVEEKVREPGMEG